ncbi:MAG TPA: orotate phosphoribosyltransferase [Virgibacillus sp.]|nr:orotate phosphoribosyltransferase [Virgibacillus sp.]
MKMNKKIAQDLLYIKAVQINTTNYFTWTSGLKSPIYCDNRLTMSYPHVRQNITKAFIQQLQTMDEKPDVIAGCATAGIPHAAWLADELNLPMVYVRSKPKEHGKGNQIEGYVEKGDRVIVIEDLISTGGSSIAAAQALQEEGAHVTHVLAIFTYGLEKAKQNFQQAKLQCHTITTFDDVLDVLSRDAKISSTEKQTLKTWRHKL